MSLLTSGAAGILTAEEVGELVVKPVERESVAMQVSSVVRTTSGSFRIPIITSDSSADWTPEGEEITPTMPGVAELDVIPKKLAALTIVSNELANDSSPDAQQVVGDSIARDLARKLDAAFFTNTTANGPSGLESVDYTLVDAGSTFDDLDPFAEAVSKAEVVGAQITAWVTHPTTLLALAQLKKLTTGSNEPLLQPDPTMPTRRQILGVPLYWSPYVDQGAVWGVPGARTFVVLRSDAELVVDPSAYFSKDSLGIRSTMRVGFGFPHPEAIVRVGAGGS